MTKGFKLVHHPFNIEEREDALLFRKQDNFEIRFSPDIFSKKIESTKSVGSRKYIEIETIDGKCEMLSETNEIHEFLTPADFYVEINQNSREFYENIYENLMDDDLEKLTSHAEKMTEFLKTNNFPECPAPLITTALHYENFTTSSTGASGDSYSSTQIRFGDDIPCQVPTETREYISKGLGEEGYEVQDRFLNHYFRNTAITKYKNIEIEYQKISSARDKELVKLTYLKKCLSMHAFYYTSGPWRHCWVRLGYDPACDRQNYKFQLLNVKSTNFQLIEYPDIIAEVEKNIDWYLLKECDATDGFISEALRNLILYKITTHEKLIE